MFKLPTLNILQSDQSTLTVDQWNLISNLSHCYDEHSGLAIAERFMREQDNLPIKLRLKSAAMLELYQIMLQDIQSLYRTNQHFLSLPTNDRSTLLHTTMTYTSALSSNFLLCILGLFRRPTYYDILAIITHPSAVLPVKRLANHLDFDIIIMKLFLAILSFSTIGYTFYSNTPPINLSNIKQILEIQDTYTELLWRYLVYKFNYERAVIYISDLIRCFFAMHECIVVGQDVQWFVEKVDSIVAHTEQVLSLNN